MSFRFMGLFDTVLSTNAGPAYNLAIPEAFAYVAHAVALNEHRGNALHPYGSVGAFPLESILPVSGTADGRVRIERGFIGAHADVGGGFAAGGHQLSQVALAWMVSQAVAARVSLRNDPELRSIIASPVIHDRSNSILTGAPTAAAEDRLVRYRDGSTTRQRQMRSHGGMTHADTERYIDYLAPDDAARRRFVTGTVDARGYLDWLGKNGYDLEMAVQ